MRSKVPIFLPPKAEEDRSKIKHREKIKKDLISPPDRSIRIARKRIGIFQPERISSNSIGKYAFVGRDG